MTLTLAGLTHDAALARKVDDFGHGCRPVGFDWVDAASITALFGDQTVGRLALPFSFPFYGDAFDAVYITDNGYVTFEHPSSGSPSRSLRASRRSSRRTPRSIPCGRT